MMKMHRLPVLFAAALLCAAPGLMAQKISSKNLTPAASIGGGVNFNLDDVFLGVNAGVTIPDYKTSLLLGFDFRPGSKKVEIEDTPSQIFVLRERRYLFTLSGEQRFAVFGNDEYSFDAYARVGAGLTFGDFRGTDWKPYSGILVTAGGGAAFSNEIVVVRLGYQYLPTRTLSIADHRICASVSLII